MREVRRRRRAAADRGAARPAARAAFGRPAPARGARPRDGAPPGRVPDGRAAVESRRQAARAHAQRARRAARAARRDVHLRDARPGRGDDDVRSRRDDGRRPHPAARHAERALRAAGEPQGRAVHRQPGDQPAAGAGRRRRARRAVRAPTLPMRVAAAGRQPRDASASGPRRDRAAPRGHAARPGTVALAARLRRIENLGSEYILHCRRRRPRAARSCTCRVPPSAAPTASAPLDARLRAARLPRLRRGGRARRRSTSTARRCARRSGLPTPARTRR